MLSRAASTARATLLAVGAGLALAPAAAAWQDEGRLPPAVEARVTAIPGVIAAGEEWELVWGGSDNADGIVGTPDGGLLFAQEQPSRIGKLDVNGQRTTYLENTNGAGSVSIDTEGNLLAVLRTCTDPGRPETLGPCEEPTKVAVLAPETRILADSFQNGEALGRLNDLVADSNGGAYFTSGGAYYVNRDGMVSTVADDIRANGIILSPDERVLYVTNRGAIVAFDRRSDGSVANRRNFAMLRDDGSGDGMAVDGAGRLYVTADYAVQVFSSGGEFLGSIPTPRRAISVAFSGPEKKTLYIVGSGAQGPDRQDLVTAAGVRNNAKSIYRISMIADGYQGRPK